MVSSVLSKSMMINHIDCLM